MTEKKKKNNKKTKVVDELENLELEQKPRLNPALYWEWRTTIEEMKSAKLNEKRVLLERDLLSREIEIKKLKLSLFRETISGANVERQKIEADYMELKKRIEEEIGMSLSNCVISDTTFEVTKIEE